MFLVGLAACVTTAHAQVPKYGVIAKWQIGGDGGWDYVSMDSPNHMLYLSRGSHMMVVDTNTGKVVGDIPNTNGVHGAAFADGAGKGYTSNGRDNTVTVFDLKTFKTLGSIPVGTGPDSILYDKFSNRVFTCNGRSQDMTAIDVNTDKVVGTFKLEGRPEAPATDNKGNVYVNIEDKSEVERFNPRTLAKIVAWSIAPAEGPSGIALDAKRHLVYSTCDKLMAVSDGLGNKLVTTVPIGNGPDAGAFDVKWGLAFSSNGQDGTISVLKRQPDGSYQTETVPTQVSARTMDLDQKTHRIYLVAAEFVPLDPNAPPPAAGERRRRQIVPGSFTVLVVGPVK